VWLESRPRECFHHLLSKGGVIFHEQDSSRHEWFPY
jgi:hypothetical protein